MPVIIMLGNLDQCTLRDPVNFFIFIRYIWSNLGQKVKNPAKNAPNNVHALVFNQMFIYLFLL